MLSFVPNFISHKSNKNKLNYTKFLETIDVGGGSLVLILFIYQTALV